MVLLPKIIKSHISETDQKRQIFISLKSLRECKDVIDCKFYNIWAGSVFISKSDYLIVTPSMYSYGKLTMKNFTKKLFVFIFVMIQGPSILYAEETCASYWDKGLYSEALETCVKEEKWFHAGYSAGLRENCTLMKLYYEKSGSGSSLGNLGIDYLYGKSGCEKNTILGEKYLMQAIEKKSYGFGKILGDMYRRQGNEKLAKQYYQIALDACCSDWRKDRASESYIELLKLMNSDEKSDFYISELKLQTTFSDENKLRVKKAVKYLANNLSVEEALSVFYKNKLDPENQCDFGRKIVSGNFTTLVTHLSKTNGVKKFIGKLCPEDAAYFMGLTYENGLGNKEDYAEAYRLYLIAGKNGNLFAKEARDRIRADLSEEDISRATCLADYGLEPSTFQKLYCKF